MIEIHGNVNNLQKWISIISISVVPDYVSYGHGSQNQKTQIEVKLQVIRISGVFCFLSKFVVRAAICSFFNLKEDHCLHIGTFDYVELPKRKTIKRAEGGGVADIVCRAFWSVADPEGGGGGLRPPLKITLKCDKALATLRNRSKSLEL